MDARSHHPSRAPGGEAVAETRGLVFDWGWRYDLLVGVADALVLRGALGTLLRRTIARARIREGEAVLDVGCGTGTLALQARAQVGTGGRVVGVDPGPRQIARARSKASRAGIPVDFQVGVVERLGFPDRSFDVVTATLMMHHLPDEVKRRGLAEVARVLRPGGRLVIADFQRPEPRGGHAPRLGAGEIGLQDLAELMEQEGFGDIEGEEIRLPRLPRLFGIPAAGLLVGTKK